MATYSIGFTKTALDGGPWIVARQTSRLSIKEITMKSNLQGGVTTP